jgi:hypothetical protein
MKLKHKIYLMQLEIKSTCIANRTTIGTPAPQRCLHGPTVCARVETLQTIDCFAQTLIHRCLTTRMARRATTIIAAAISIATPIRVVIFAGTSPIRSVINAASVTQVEPTTIPSPQRGLQVATVGTLFTRFDAPTARRTATRMAI